jgi:hypothetical protein
VNRANAVRDYLVAHGIAADRITSEGHGPDRSIADNKSAEGRANNRRVEIVVKAGKPPRNPRSTSAADDSEVRKMNGTNASSAWARSRRTSDQPSMPRMWTSEMIRSGRAARALARAIVPSLAKSISSGRLLSRDAVTCRIHGSSSTTNTR